MFGLGSRLSLGLAAVASMVIDLARPMDTMRYAAPLPSRRYRSNEGQSTRSKLKGGRKAWSLRMNILNVRARRKANVLRKRRERKRGKLAGWRVVSDL